MAVDELGHPIFFDGVVALVRALQMSRFATSDELLLGHGGRREL